LVLAAGLFIALALALGTDSSAESIDTRDLDDMERDYFRPGDDVFFSFIGDANETYGVYALNPEQISTMVGSFVTDMDGNYSSVERGIFYTLPSNAPFGAHMLSLRSQGNQELANHTFQVYEAEYSAEIGTTGIDRDIQKRIFMENETCYYWVQVVDQHGQPYSEKAVTLKLANGGILDSTVTDSNGKGEGFFTTSLDPGSHKLEARVNVDVVGSHNIEVAFIHVGIYPKSEDMLYHPGTELSLTFSTNAPSINKVDVYITGEEDTVLNFWANQSLDNGNWARNYTLQSNAVQGRYVLNVVDSDTGFLLGRMEFQIWPFYFIPKVTRDTVLPGETINVFFQSFKMDQQEVPVTINWRLYYSAGVARSMSGHIDGYHSYGVFPITLPEDPDAEEGMILKFWANNSQNEIIVSEIHLDIGVLSGSMSTSSGIVVTSGVLRVDLASCVSGFPIGDIHVNLTMQKGGERVTNIEGLTNSAGEFSTLIPIANNAQLGMYNLRVSMWHDPSGSTVNLDADVEIINGNAPLVTVAFDKDGYYSGELAMIYTHAVDSNGQDIESCRYSLFQGMELVDSGFSNGDPIMHQIDDDFVGLLRLETSCQDQQGRLMERSEQCQVRAARLTINTNKRYYQPGERILVSYNLHGADAEAVYMIVEALDGTIKSQPFKGERMTIDVPKAAPPESYRVQITALSDGHIVSETIELELAQYYIRMTFEKGPYGPGDTVKINFRVVQLRDSDILNLPLTITYGIQGLPPIITNTSSTSGVLLYSIPTNMPDGNYIMSMSIASTQYEAGAVQGMEVEEGFSFEMMMLWASIVLSIVSLLVCIVILRYILIT